MDKQTVFFFKSLQGNTQKIKSLELLHTLTRSISMAGNKPWCTRACKDHNTNYKIQETITWQTQWFHLRKSRDSVNFTISENIIKLIL